MVAISPAVRFFARSEIAKYFQSSVVCDESTLLRTQEIWLALGVRMAKIETLRRDDSRHSWKAPGDETPSE
jgi:hypothetical protein